MRNTARYSGSVKTSDEIRLANLQRLAGELNADAGHELSGPEFAAAIGVSDVYEWQLRKGKRKKIDEKAARTIERKTGKPRGWLDNDECAWPFVRVDRSRYDALDLADKVFVQDAMNAAISNCEARAGMPPHTGGSTHIAHPLHERSKQFGT